MSKRAGADSDNATFVPAEPTRSLGSKLLRFPLVGALSSAVYAVSTWFYIAHLDLGESAASFAGYATAIPFSYLAHRRFTFASRGAVSMEVKRFALLHVFGMLVAWGSMWATGAFRLHYAFGIVAAVVLVPLLSFFVMDRWVFNAHPRRSGTGPQALEPREQTLSER